MSRNKHQCEGVQGWDSIVKDYDGEWVLSLDCNCCTILINYCPFCGIKLEDGKELNINEEGTTHRP